MKENEEKLRHNVEDGALGKLLTQKSHFIYENKYMAKNDKRSKSLNFIVLVLYIKICAAYAWKL